MVALVCLAPLVVGGIVFRNEDCSTVECALPLSFGAPIYVVALGYVVFFIQWRLRPLAKYLSRLREEPTRFLEGPYNQASWDEVIHRDKLYEAVGIELRAGPQRAQFLTGPPGSGKTTCLLGLAAWLANRGAVPVLVPLAGVEPPIDLAALAKPRFIRILDASDAQGDRLWRQLCHAGRVVILADGLDEAALGASELDLRQLGGEPRVGRQPAVVFSSRPAAVPGGNGAPPFQLDELNESAISESLQRRARADGVSVVDAESAGPLANALAMPREPFYLDLVVTVLAGLEPDRARRLVGRLKSNEVQRARKLLLDEYFALLTAGLILKEVPVDRPHRADALREVEQIALRMLTEEASAAPLDALVNGWSGVLGEPRSLRREELIEYACRLGIVQITRSGPERKLRFRHSIIQAYLAANAMVAEAAIDGEKMDGRTNDPSWKEFLSYNTREESLLSVRFLSLGREWQAEDVVTFLLTRASSREFQNGLLYAATAANIVADNSLDRIDAVCEVIKLGWEHAAKTSRFAVVRALGTLDDKRSYELLWKLISKSGYELTWEFVEVLTSAAGESAWDALKPAIDMCLRKCMRDPAHAEEKALLPELSTVAKFLPSLAAKSTSPAPRNALATLVGLVEEMAKANHGLGVEASLAQGFKQAAKVKSSAPSDGADRAAQIAAFLSWAKFWYSRVNALQALVLLTDQTGNLGGARAAIELRREDRHPLVRATAKLACEALDAEPSERASYVWHDESVDVARSGVELQPNTSQLLAEVVLILNMNEQDWAGASGEVPRADGQEVREDGENKRLEVQRWAVGTLDILPSCIKLHRTRLLDAGTSACVAGCPFHLCPYSSPGQRKTGQVALEHAHRGDPSAAFCLHQKRLLFLFSHRVPEWLRWRPPPFDGSPRQRWPNPLRRQELRNYWGRMQARAEGSDTGSPRSGHI
jgi:hypothetical protein